MLQICISRVTEQTLLADIMWYGLSLNICKGCHVVVIFFSFFCFDAAIFELLHDVEALFLLP